MNDLCLYAVKLHHLYFLFCYWRLKSMLSVFSTLWSILFSVFPAIGVAAMPPVGCQAVPPRAGPEPGWDRPRGGKERNGISGRWGVGELSLQGQGAPRQGTCADWQGLSFRWNSWSEGHSGLRCSQEVSQDQAVRGLENAHDPMKFQVPARPRVTRRWSEVGMFVRMQEMPAWPRQWAWKVGDCGAGHRESFPLFLWTLGHFHRMHSKCPKSHLMQTLFSDTHYQEVFVVVIAIIISIAELTNNTDHRLRD